MNEKDTLQSNVEFKSPDRLCRLCLSEGGTLHPLFRPEGLHSRAIELSLQVTMCTAVKVSKFDLLPKKICTACRTFVQEWHIFRKKCLSSDSMLKTIFNKPKIDVKIESDSVADTSLELLGRENGIFSTIEKDNQLQSFVNSEKQCFQCDLCPESFPLFSELTLHKLNLHVPITPKSEVKKMKTRDESFPRKVRIKFEMECCDIVFVSRGAYRQHRQLKHPTEKPFACDICGKRNFISDETLKRHKILHTGRFACKLCLRTFTCQATLRIHVRDKHENDHPFVCDVCGKAYVTELLLNYHQRFHRGEKKYVCEECGTAVVTSSSLAKHKRTHSKIKPHVCEVCAKGFTVRGRLTEHMRLHTGERPFICEVCQKSFTRRDKLKRHYRTHFDHKPYSCEVCGRGYSTNYGLSIHLKTHSSRP